MVKRDSKREENRWVDHFLRLFSDIKIVMKLKFTGCEIRNGALCKKKSMKIILSILYNH